MEDKNIKKRKRDFRRKYSKYERRLMAVQIKMYWLAWTMKERMTIDIDYSNQD